MRPIAMSGNCLDNPPPEPKCGVKSFPFLGAVRVRVRPFPASFLMASETLPTQMLQREHVTHLVTKINIPYHPRVLDQARLAVLHLVDAHRPLYLSSIGHVFVAYSHKSTRKRHCSPSDGMSMSPSWATTRQADREKEPRGQQSQLSLAGW